MKILFVADGRSPIALNWIRYFVNKDHEVHLVSLYPCRPELTLSSLEIIPVAFSSAVTISKRDQELSLKDRFLKFLATPRFRTWFRQRIVPRSLPAAALRLKTHVNTLQPDIIHAMRIPFEGMLAALASKIDGNVTAPLLISVWGNDFTLHAPATLRLSQLTHLSLKKADALHTDCERDQGLAVTWGFDLGKPAVVLPGAGGIQLDTFYPGNLERGQVIINPRGLRAYIRSDTFFQSIPLVLARHPQAKFICPNMRGRREAERWVHSLGIEASVEMIQQQTRAQMADLFRQSRVVVSPSTHDGTPNTLLEAMACGCTPVAGDLDSIREWITPGMNGLLVDPADPRALADAIIEALENRELQTRSSECNFEMIRKRAEYPMVMGEADKFYNQLVNLAKCA